MITTPTPEEVAACVARAAAVGPTIGPLIVRYRNRTLPNDPAVAKALHEAGERIVPTVRFADQIETAIYAAVCDSEEFARYVRSLYAENRIITPHPARASQGGRSVYTN